MEPFSSPSVSIDGDAIRNIREEGRLTQFYVAKVVGVTTDTVSRWENNRYPTIRRDNALKLAEALEVALEDILKQDDPAPDVDVQAPGAADSRNAWRKYTLFILLILVTVALYLFSTPTPQVIDNVLRGQRVVPHYSAPGTRLPIHLEINSQKKVKGLIVKEEFPPGWNLVEADPPPSSLDNLNGSVRWMLRNPDQVKQIVYVLQVPKNVPMGKTISLSGEVVANPEGQRFSIVTASTGSLRIAPLHWADVDGNSQIDDLEILEVSDRIDQAENIHYDWDLVERMWDAGAYKYDLKTQSFAPRKQPPVSDK